MMLGLNFLKSDPFWFLPSIRGSKSLPSGWNLTNAPEDRGLTAWRRHRPHQAAQTAAAQGWRWPTRRSLHPAWTLQLPLRLEHKHDEWNDLKWQTRTWQRGLRPLEGGKHKWVLLAITSTQTLEWTNAHSDSGRQMFADIGTGNTRWWGAVYPLDCLKETSCVCADFRGPAEHIVQHTRTDSPSKAWLPKQSWVAARNHSVSQVATGKVTQSLPRCFVPGWIRLTGRSHCVFFSPHIIRPQHFSSGAREPLRLAK